MLENIFHLLDFIKDSKVCGQYSAIALGQNKLPESIREAYKLSRDHIGFEIDPTFHALCEEINAEEMNSVFDK